MGDVPLRPLDKLTYAGIGLSCKIASPVPEIILRIAAACLERWRRQRQCNSTWSHRRFVLFPRPAFLPPLAAAFFPVRIGVVRHLASLVPLGESGFCVQQPEPKSLPPIRWKMVPICLVMHVPAKDGWFVIFAKGRKPMCK